MGKLKNIMNRIREFINSFANPIEPEGNLDELAVAAGVSASDLSALKKSMNGVNWKFADENKEPKIGKITGIVSTDASIKQVQRTQIKERKAGTERD